AYIGGLGLTGCKGFGAASLSASRLCRAARRRGMRGRQFSNSPWKGRPNVPDQSRSEPRRAESSALTRLSGASKRSRLALHCRVREWPRFGGNLAMRLDPALQSAMLAAVPDMRAFALSLCHQRDRVDDLVQEALLRAIVNIESFKGGNMTAWLFTILRHNFFNEHRRSRHEVAHADDYFIGTMASQPDQEGHLQLTEFCSALAQLPHDQREAVVLVGGAGLSYTEAAK